MLEKILSFAQIGADYAAMNQLPAMPLDDASEYLHIFREGARVVGETEDPSEEHPEEVEEENEDPGEDAAEGSGSEVQAEQLEPGDYIVEKILEYNSQKKRYLVRWEGYGPEEDSWESKTNLRRVTVFKQFEKARLQALEREAQDEASAEAAWEASVRQSDASSSSHNP